MALKRVLPSRLTGAPQATGAIVTSSSPNTPAASTAQASAPATNMPNSTLAAAAPENPIIPPASAFTSAASSAFSTLPTTPPQPQIAPEAQPAKPTRILEDSFPTPQQPKPEHPNVVPVNLPVASETVTTASATIEVPAIPIIAPENTEKPQAEPQATPQGPTDFLTPALQASKPAANPLKRKVGQVASLPQTKSIPPQSMPEAKPKPTVTNSAQATQTKRQRVITPRNFAAATVASPEAKSSARAALEGAVAMASNVPIDTRPLNRVDEELIASGIMAAPKGDSLTSQVPMGVAESESFTDFSTPYPLPETAPEFVPTSPQNKKNDAQSDQTQPSKSSSVPIATQEISPPTAPLARTEPSKLYGVAASAPVQNPLPPVQSNLPWVPSPQSVGSETTNSWDVPTPAKSSISAPNVPTPATQTADFFKPVLATQPAAGSNTTPLWSQLQQGKTGFPPPELPGARKRNALQKNGMSGFVWGVGGLAAAGIALFLWSQQQASSTLPQQINQLANLTQPQNNAPATPNTPGTSNFSIVDFKSTLTPPAAPTTEQSPSPGSTAQIAFTDTPSEQTNGPIAADGSETMPEDVSVFARLQQAIAQRKAEKTGTPNAPVPLGTTAVVPEESAGLTPEKLQEELAAYRQALASGELPQSAPASANPPTSAAPLQPTPQPYMGANQLAEAGQQGLLPPPSELYTNNPSNLPIVGEPAANAPARIRDLSDFQVEPFEPERPKVLMPRNLKPRLAATDFPSIEVLSFVPSRGIIAYASGREGVLLVGETIEGWELTNVTGEMAEFKAGQKSHYITAQN